MHLEGVIKGPGDKSTEQDMVEFYYATCNDMWHANDKNSLTVFRPHHKGLSLPVHFEGVLKFDKIVDHVAKSIWPHVMTFSGRESVNRLYGNETGR